MMTFNYIGFQYNNYSLSFQADPNSFLDYFYDLIKTILVLNRADNKK
jgi:hypothetical protein